MLVWPRADALVFGTQVMEIRNQLVTMTNSDNSGPEIRRLEAEVESLKAYKVGQCLTALDDWFWLTRVFIQLPIYSHLFL